MLNRLCAAPRCQFMLMWIIVIALLGCAEIAHAQGTMGMLPGPISTVELDGYAQRLRASPQQRRAMDAIHDHYKNEFRALRETEIAEFLKTMRQMDEGDLMPQRKRLEEFMRQMDVLIRKISTLDNRLFDEIQPVLTEEQLAMMPRVRLARQRNRYDKMQVVWMGGERPVDISEIVAGMDFSDADRAVASDLLGPYESRLTADMEKMYQGSTKTITGVYDALAGLGFDEQMMQDPDQMEKVGEAMQTVWMDLMSKNIEQVRGVAELNDRTMRSIAAAVSPDVSRDFRNRYYRRAYPEAAYAMFMHDYVFAPALRRDDLTPQQREALTVVRDDMLRKLDSVLERAVANAQQWRNDVNPFTYDQTRAEAYQKKMVDLRAESDRIRDEANAALLAALGEELLDKIGRIKYSHHEPDSEEAEIAMGGDIADFDLDDDEADAMFDDEDDDIDAGYAHGFDQFVPPAISPAEFAEMAQILELSDEQQIVARDLHQRYVQAFEAKSQREFAELQKIVNAMWVWDEQTNTSRGPTELTVTTAYRLRGEAMEAVRRSDNEFFTEIEIAVLTPEQIERLPRVRLTRDRTVYNRGATHWGVPEASMDVSRLVRRQRGLFNADQWAPIDEELFRYEKAVVPMFQKRFERTMDVQKAQELWQAEAARLRAAGDESAMRTAGMRYGEIMREPQRALAEVALELSAFNRQSMARIAALAEGEAGHTLRAAYNRAAHPAVYSDGGSMDKPLRLARALPDLTPEQSRQLSDLAAQYHPAYAAVCERMIEANAGTGYAQMWASPDESNAEDWQKHEESLAKLRFDRSELNARAAGSLRAILNEDQLKRIGGLPKISTPGEFDF